MVCEGIYVTLGAEQLKEKPYKEQIKDFLICDGETGFYWWKMSMKPKHEFSHVFIVIGNKVRWRARFLEFRENEAPEFWDGRTMYSKLWMLLIDFEPMPHPFETRKGFQGFRYKLENNY